MWRGGCIIRSVFLKDITSAFRRNPELENLLFDKFFNDAIHKAQNGWRDVVSKGALWGIPTPAFSTALSFYDGLRSQDLPANLLQAQRDYFGAHTFRMKPEKATDSKPAGEWELPVLLEFGADLAFFLRSRHSRKLDRKGRQRVCLDLHGIDAAMEKPSSRPMQVIHVQLHGHMEWSTCHGRLASHRPRIVAWKS